MKESGNHIITLFKKYFNKNASRIETRELEQEAQENPYLRDAMEGTDKMSMVNRSTSIENLEDRLAKRIGNKQSKKSPMPWLKLAAGVALLLSVGFFIWRPISNGNISSVEQTEKKRVIFEDGFNQKSKATNSETTIEEYATSENSNTFSDEENESSISNTNAETSEANNTSDFSVQLPPKQNPPISTNENVVVQNNIPAASPRKPSANNTPRPSDVVIDGVRLNTEKVIESDVIERSEVVVDNEIVDTDISVANADDMSVDDSVETDMIAANESSTVKEEAKASMQQGTPIDELASTSAGVRAKKKKANTRQIKGTLTDENGDALIGASVVEKGTRNGTITDIDGTYSLDVSEDANSLVISYTGFDTQEVALGNSNQVDISLEQGVELSEVVITGLGSSDQRESTASYSDYPSEGMNKFKAYVKANLAYPQAAKEAGIKGKVILLFDVNNAGRPINIEIKKSLGSGCDEEAIRLLEEGPKWEQGNREGKIKLTIRFK